jgi:hypothetical protein
MRLSCETILHVPLLISLLYPSTVHHSPKTGYGHHQDVEAMMRPL